MINRFLDGPVVFSGGVARNAAITELLIRHTGREVIALTDPTMNGALGCALNHPK
jgi:activator of 2-hydroxyglutaryl-CoA dehydratase